MHESDAKALTDEERLPVERAFYLIQQDVAEFGSALHAYDRGYVEAADRIEEQATASIRQTFDATPILRELLPKLWARLAGGQNIADSGYDILDEIARAKQRL